LIPPFQLLPSTTSHKREPLVPTLEVFARLGLCDLDLNLNHFVERGATVDEVRGALAANRQRVWIVSGGWCDFFDAEPEIQKTMASVARQVELARAFGVTALRLFFGRLPAERYSGEARATIVANIRRLGERYPDMQFVFENHDGVSSRPRVCREILEHVGLPNVRAVFDPINFEHRGANSLDAVKELLPLIAHVHLKGYDRGEFCEFGEGEVDLTAVLETLGDGGYDRAFTVEYEGPFDRTLRLFQSVKNAQSAIDRLRAR
jgi:sugar phosphate isomerase/epimerase